MNDMSLNILLVTALVAAALATIMTARLLWSAVGLALTSAILTLIMFRLGAPIAGVFELSVCAGLIPAVFISVIGLTRRLTPEELTLRKKAKLKKYGLLPVAVVLVAVALSQLKMPMDFTPIAAAETDIRKVLWNMRYLDLLGQIVVLLAGAFGVVVLLKEPRNER